MSEGQRSPIFTIFLTVFIDLLGVTLVIPILAPLLVESDAILTSSYEDRTMILGYLLAIFSLAQFLFAPFWGSLSDKYGRKNILFISLIFSLLGYLLFAQAILMNSLWILFVGRILSGIGSGNLSVIFSSIADVSSPEDKPKNFGLVGVAFGLGFIIGPVVGGILADPSVVSWFNSEVPFYVASGLVSLNLVLVYLSFPETLKTRNETVNLSVFTGFRNLKKAFQTPSLRTIFLIISCLPSASPFLPNSFRCF